MKNFKEQIRLNAIKEKFVILPRSCKCCGDAFIFGKMFYVERHGVNKKVDRWYYCPICTPTKEDVLKKVGTDDAILTLF